MGRLEELVSPGNGLVSKSHFARSRAFVAIENLLEDLSGLSCLIDKSVRGYLCSSRRREREDWTEFLEGSVWLLCGKNGEHK